jgi:hypothetical protein
VDVDHGADAVALTDLDAVPLDPEQVCREGTPGLRVRSTIGAFCGAKCATLTVPSVEKSDSAAKASTSVRDAPLRIGCVRADPDVDRPLRAPNGA